MNHYLNQVEMVHLQTLTIHNYEKWKNSVEVKLMHKIRWNFEVEGLLLIWGAFLAKRTAWKAKSFKNLKIELRKKIEYLAFWKTGPEFQPVWFYETYSFCSFFLFSFFLCLSIFFFFAFLLSCFLAFFIISFL